MIDLDATPADTIPIMIERYAGKVASVLATPNMHLGGMGPVTTNCTSMSRLLFLARAPQSGSLVRTGRRRSTT